MKPFDVSNEQAVLGTLIRSRVLRKAKLGSVKSDLFVLPLHKEILRAIRRADGMGGEISPVSVLTYLPEEFSDLEYVKQIYEMDVSENFDPHFARLIEEKKRVESIGLVESLSAGLADRNRSLEDLLQDVNRVGSCLSEGVILQERDVKAEWLENFDRMVRGEKRFRTTGFPSLDSKLGEGFFPGGLTVVGGRSRVGKSSFVIEILARLLKEEKRPKILMVPLEGGPARVLDSLISNLSGVPLEMLIKYTEKLTQEQKKAVKDWAEWIFDGCDFVLESDFFGSGKQFEKRGWGNAAALDRIEELVASQNFDLVVWDLFERALTDLDPHKLSAALFRMQNISVRYQTHQILVQQLKRVSEERKDPRPVLVDLKNSGAYEEVSDLVLLVHRERLYKPFIREDLIEVTIAKQKRGEDAVTMIGNFHPEVCRISCDRIGSVQVEQTPGIKFVEG